MREGIDGTSTVRAYLVFDGNMKIEEESDDRTDHNFDPTGTKAVYRCKGEVQPGLQR